MGFANRLLMSSGASSRKRCSRLEETGKITERWLLLDDLGRTLQVADIVGVSCSTGFPTSRWLPFYLCHKPMPATSNLWKEQDKEGTKPIKKSELAEKLANAEGITLRAAELAVEVTFESMADALSRSGRVEIRGFGSFKVKGYEAYSGRNPMTGEQVEVQPKKLPVFKVGKDLRQRVNGGEEEQHVQGSGATAETA